MYLFVLHSPGEGQASPRGGERWPRDGAEECQRRPRRRRAQAEASRGATRRPLRQAAGRGAGQVTYVLYLTAHHYGDGLIEKLLCR